MRFSAPKAFLSFFRKMNYFTTLVAAAIFEFGGTMRALNKEQVAVYVGAINMMITSLSALVTIANDIIGNSFAKPFIKNTVFALEFAGDIFFLDFAGIGNDATMQLICILKSIMAQVG
jgi:hypothetical protein